MKKLLSVLFALCLLTFAGCSIGPEHNTSLSANSAGTKRPAISVDDNVITAGNFKIPIPDGFEATSSEENTASIASEDGGCFIGIFAADVSSLTEEQIIGHLPSQHDSFMTDGASRSDERETATQFGPIDIILNLYAEKSADLNATINMDASFTDSWYSYTIMFRCYAGSDKISEYSTSFAEFCGYAEYIGAEARFSFVQ